MNGGNRAELRFQDYNRELVYSRNSQQQQPSQGYIASKIIFGLVDIYSCWLLELEV